MTDSEKKVRSDARDALGRAYSQRLGAAYAVMLDGEGLLHQYGDGNMGEAINRVCDAMRRIREEGELDF